jgi:hypothetical protein
MIKTLKLPNEKKLFRLTSREIIIIIIIILKNYQKGLKLRFMSHTFLRWDVLVLGPIKLEGLFGIADYLNPKHFMM